MPSPREQPPAPGQGPRGRRRPEAMPGGWLWFLLLLMLVVFLYFALSPSPDVIDYTEFMRLAEKEYFPKVPLLGPARAVGEFKKEAVDQQPPEIKKHIRY